MVDAVVIKMCCDYVCCHIVCRVLDWCKGMDFLPDWKNYDSSRVLSCRTSDTCTSLRYSHYLTVALGHSALLKVFADIAVCCLVGYSADSPRLKGLSLSENNLSVRMCLRLILS